MDGAQISCRYFSTVTTVGKEVCCVGRRPSVRRSGPRSKENPVSSSRMYGVNPYRLKSKVSSKMFIRRGLVDPKCYPNWSNANGKQVNIPVPRGYVRQRKGKS